MAGNKVYVGSNDGRFYVLDLAKGTKLWEFNAGGALSASPAIAGGRVVIEIVPDARIGFDAEEMFRNSPAGSTTTRITGT